MEIKGKIILDLPMQEGISKAGNAWKKKEWVMETIDTPYPRKVKFHLFGDRADNVHLELGKSYTLQCEVESREFNGRWYTDVAGLSATEIGGGNTDFGPQQMGGMQMNQFGGVPVQDFSKGDDESDLPF